MASGKSRQVLPDERLPIGTEVEVQDERGVVVGYHEATRPQDVVANVIEFTHIKDPFEGWRPLKPEEKHEPTGINYSFIYVPDDVRANYRQKITATWTKPIDQELLNIMNDTFDGSVATVAYSILGGGENKIERMASAFGLKQLEVFYKFIKSLVDSGKKYKGLFELYGLSKEAIDQLRDKRWEEKITPEDVINAPMHPDVKDIKSNYRAKITKQAEIGDTENLKQNGNAIISEFEKSPLGLKLKCQPWSGWLKKLMSIKFHIDKYAKEHPEDAEIQLIVRKISAIENYLNTEESISYPQAIHPSIKYYNEEFGTNLVEN